jgi:hypothetical protein
MVRLTEENPGDLPDCPSTERTMRTPSLRQHKPSGLAVVTLNGKDHYLGPWPAGQRKPPREAQDTYDRLIAE